MNFYTFVVHSSLFASMFSYLDPWAVLENISSRVVLFTCFKADSYSLNFLDWYIHTLYIWSLIFQLLESHVATISVRIAARTVALLLFLGALYRQGCQFLSLYIVHSAGINAYTTGVFHLHGRYIYICGQHYGCNTYEDDCLYNVCSRSHIQPISKM